MNAETQPDTQIRVGWFENNYHCSECGTEWTDEWSCMCDDRCPECDAEIEPTSSIDLSRSLTAEDYMGAARLITGSSDRIADVTDEEARDYAEAVMEGDEHRFEFLSRVKV